MIKDLEATTSTSKPDLSYQPVRKRSRFSGREDRLHCSYQHSLKKRKTSNRSRNNEGYFVMVHRLPGAILCVIMLRKANITLAQGKRSAYYLFISIYRSTQEVSLNKIFLSASTHIHTFACLISKLHLYCHVLITNREIFQSIIKRILDKLFYKTLDQVIFKQKPLRPPNLIRAVIDTGQSGDSST